MIQNLSICSSLLVLNLVKEIYQLYQQVSHKFTFNHILFKLIISYSNLEVRERGEYTLDDILKIGEVVYNDEIIAKDLVDALLFISGGKDIISASELRRYLLLTGSIVKLTEEEVDCILSDIGESIINIYDFIAYCITEQ